MEAGLSPATTMSVPKYQKQRHQSRLYQSVAEKGSVPRTLHRLDPSSTPSAKLANDQRRFLWWDLFQLEKEREPRPIDRKKREIQRLLRSEYDLVSENLIRLRYEHPSKSGESIRGTIRRWLVEVLQVPRWVAINQLESWVRHPNRHPFEAHFMQPNFDLAFAEFWVAVAHNWSAAEFERQHPRALDPRRHNSPLDSEWVPFPDGLDVFLQKCQHVTEGVICQNLVRYGPRCPVHSTVRVGVSGIPFARLGLFTMSDIRPGAEVCLYVEKGIRVERMTRTQLDAKPENAYLFSWCPDEDQAIEDLPAKGQICVVDASDSNSGFGRYINDVKMTVRTRSITPQYTANAIFKRPKESYHDDDHDLTSDTVPYIEASRHIYAGEEIFVDYGTLYWTEEELHDHQHNALAQFSNPERFQIHEERIFVDMQASLMEKQIALVNELNLHRWNHNAWYQPNLVKATRPPLQRHHQLTKYRPGSTAATAPPRTSACEPEAAVDAIVEPQDPMQGAWQRTRMSPNRLAELTLYLKSLTL